MDQDSLSWITALATIDRSSDASRSSIRPSGSFGVMVDSGEISSARASSE